MIGRGGTVSHLRSNTPPNDTPCWLNAQPGHAKDWAKEPPNPLPSVTDSRPHCEDDPTRALTARKACCCDHATTEKVAPGTQKPWKMGALNMR